MSKTEKKSQKKLLVFAIIVAAVIVVAFVPTIYQSLMNKRDVSVLFDKYGFSYTVTNNSHVLVSCNQCENVSVLERERRDRIICPECASSSVDKYYINYVYTFYKITVTGEEGEEELLLEGGTVYVFDSTDYKKAYSILKESNDDKVILAKRYHVFVLNNQPSEYLSKVIDKLV
ncbi:MAG: hypothetical protein J1F65_06135 [Clostridiales bacterium]|nr:hypothetical protein [Clostridiales bacterium]